MVIEIEKFYGCYCLVSANPKYKGRTYIGFTVDPNRRVNQHNIGKHKGGAWRTSGKGPWDMVLIIHGFPNMVSALQFEWAWQHPSTSHKLKHIKAPPGCKHGFKFRFYVVSEMLRIGPWNRLPLTIRWLNQDHTTEFEPNLQPPMHMPITYGPVRSSQSKSMKTSENDTVETCVLCHKDIQHNDLITCLRTKCSLKAHIICLAKSFLNGENEKTMLLPVQGNCPSCHDNMLWGDLIRHKQGCYIATKKVEAEQCSFDTSLGHWGTQLNV